MTNSSAAVRRIKLFNDVRDQPFHIDLEDPSKDRSGRSKVRSLMKAFQGMRIVSHQVCHRFRWDQFDLPPELLKIAPAPAANSWTLRVKIPVSHQKQSNIGLSKGLRLVSMLAEVDPAFGVDLKNAVAYKKKTALTRAEFPVMTWDGVNSTGRCFEPFVTFSVNASKQLWDMHEQVPEAIRAEHRRDHGAFYAGINEWIAARRNQPEGLNA